MSQITVNRLTFCYEGSYDNIFNDVSFQIDTDWKLGFIGRNGRGKTTFLNLLRNKYGDQGAITSNVPFTFFPIEIPDESVKTEAVIETILDGDAFWKIQRELNLLEVFEDVLQRPFSTLSSGEKTKVQLASLFVKEDNFYLIDEPTNHLDAAGREIVSRYLAGKKGFILVSHDRSFLDSCVDHILSINKTNIEVQRGNFSSWWENKQRQDRFELSEKQRLEKDIQHLQNAVKRTSDWSDKVEKTKYHTKSSGLKPDRGYVGHRAAKMMKRSKEIDARRNFAVEEKSILLKNIENTENLFLKPLHYHTSKLIELRDVQIHYGENVICNPLSFTVNQGDRIALCGKNGSGKSSVLKLICGEEIQYSGYLQIGSQLKVSHVSQDTSYLSGNLQDFAKKHSLDVSRFQSILRKLDFDRVQFEKEIDNFSAGQKKKILLAKSICESAHLYVWDEPLNYIDVFSRMQIEEILMTRGATVLLVEHDRSFVSAIATKQINM